MSQPRRRSRLRQFIELALAFSLWLPAGFLLFDDFSPSLGGIVKFEAAALGAAAIVTIAGLVVDNGGQQASQE